jgi:hypothetical protein
MTRPLQLPLGAAVHVFLATLASNPPASSREISERAAVAARAGAATVPKQMMLRARLASAGAAYVRYLEPGWEYLGREVAVPGARLDMVWRRPDGSVVGEENKSGIFFRPFDAAEVDAQVARLLSGSRVAFGEIFAGLRVLRLFAADLSFFAHPDGARTPIDVGGNR